MGPKRGLDTHWKEAGTPYLLEGGAEAVQCLFVVTGSPALEADHALVAEVTQRRGDGRVVDLARSRLAPPGNVGDLDLPEVGQGALDQPDEVPLADLGVIQVQVHPDVR